MLNKIKNYLLKDTNDDIKNLKTEMKELKDLIDSKDKEIQILKSVQKGREYELNVFNSFADKINDKNYELNEALKVSKEIKNYIENVLDIGVDVHTIEPESSWAVFCVGGRSDYVRFTRLNQKDIRSLSQFIKKFEGCDVKVDSCLPRSFFLK